MQDLDEALAAQAQRMEPALIGPIRVVAERRQRSGTTIYQVTARRLVPVDENDPSLQAISIALPGSCELEVGPSGLTRVTLAPADADAVREARAFVRNLIANGAVRGLDAPAGHVRRGPALARPTHEVRTDPAGRRVIERVGFTAT